MEKIEIPSRGNSGRTTPRLSSSRFSRDNYEVVRYSADHNASFDNLVNRFERK